MIHSPKHSYHTIFHTISPGTGLFTGGFNATDALPQLCHSLLKPARLPWHWPKFFLSKSALILTRILRMLESQSFRGRQASSQLCFTFARRQGLPASLHPFLDFPAPGLLGAGVDVAAYTGYSLEAFHLVMLVVPEQSQKVMVRLQLSRRRCCKPRNPKMGYHLGSQDLACHLSGLPSLHPALQT